MIADSVARACGFLAARQDADGFWRDYDLPPGASTAWVTAFVGFSLGDEHPATQSRALAALRSSCRPTGWGYNAAVATDADTTSWVVRWFARMRMPLPLDASSCLLAYLGPGGGARTFASAPRFGRWTFEHVDVTAILGMALVECGAASEVAGGIRRWLLDQRNGEGRWNSFWWTFDAYATAHVLALLRTTGGVPDDVRATSHAFVRAHAEAATTMEAASLLQVALRSDADPEPWTSILLERQCDDGGWPASRTLRVPHQQAASDDEPAFEDTKRLMSTAMALMALREVSDEVA